MAAKTREAAEKAARDQQHNILTDIYEFDISASGPLTEKSPLPADMDRNDHPYVDENDPDIGDEDLTIQDYFDLEKEAEKLKPDPNQGRLFV
jgi:hypothetical protein